MSDPLDDYLKNNKKQKSEATPNKEADKSSALLNRLDRNISDEEIAKIAAAKKKLIKNIIILDALLVPVIIAIIYFSSSDKEAQQPAPAVQTQVQTQVQPSAPLSKIEQAYKDTNVERVKFDSTFSTLPYEEKIYLEQLFAITDKMVIERVYNQRALANRQPIRQEFTYANAVRQMGGLKVPESAKEIHTLITDAILEEIVYLDSRQDFNMPFDSNSDSVQEIHTKLIKAWQLILAAYPNESAHNKTAFEKHLCALDFI